MLRNIIRRATDSLRDILLCYCAIILLSSILFSYAEAKPLFDSLWWACVTAVTIGYGDIYPVTVVGKLIAFFLMHVVTLGIIPLIVTHIMRHMLDDSDNFSHAEQEEIKSELREIKELLYEKNAVQEKTS